MTKQDIDDILKAICPCDTDFNEPCISPAYLKQELEHLALDQHSQHSGKESMLLEFFANQDDAVLDMAYLYATNLCRFGVNVDEKWSTVTEQSSALESAYRGGYYDALQRSNRMQEFDLSSNSKFEQARRLMFIELECVQRNIDHKCNRDCANCDLVQTDEDLIQAYQAAIFALDHVIEEKARGTIKCQ